MILMINGCPHRHFKRPAFDRMVSQLIEAPEPHPLGVSFMLKKVSDNNTRFIRQKDGTMFVFNIVKWKNKGNPYFHKSPDELFFDPEKAKALQKAFLRVASWFY